MIGFIRATPTGDTTHYSNLKCNTSFGGGIRINVKIRKLVFYYKIQVSLKLYDNKYHD
jgi:hypothetical protein